MIITFYKVNKHNVKSVIEIHEETREIEQEIFTKNMKMEVAVAPDKVYIKKTLNMFLQRVMDS